MTGSIKQLTRFLKQKFPTRKLEDHLKKSKYIICAEDINELNNLQKFLSKKNKYSKKVIAILSQALQEGTIETQDLNIYESFSEWLILEETLYYTNAVFSTIVDNEVIYSLPDGDEIIINEERDLLASNGTTGYRTWEAASFLCYYLIFINPNLLCGGEISSALELGCGTGFLGIFLAKMMKTVSFRLTDGSNLVTEKCFDNVVANNLDLERVTVEELIWGEESEEDQSSKFDLVFGADITFDSQYIPALVDTIISRLKKDGVCIISATIRNENTISTLYKCMENLGDKWKLQKVYELPNSFCTEIEDSDTKKYRDDFVKNAWFEDLVADIHIYKISRCTE